MATLQHTSLKTFIKRHPVLTYFTLTFAISWGTLLLVVGPAEITAENTSAPFIFVYLATVAGPSIAGVLLTSLIYGRAGVTGFLEELGWTGFAVPLLQQRYSVLITGLFVGFLWGAWHFLSNYLGSATSSGALSLALSLPALLFSFLPPYRVLMVWVYDHTKSLLVAMLMHASLVTFWLIFTPLAISGVNQVTWYLVWAVVLWTVVAAVVVANSGKLSRSENTSAIPFSQHL